MTIKSGDLRDGKIQEPPKVLAGKTAGRPAEKLAIRNDTFDGGAVPIPTEAQRQQAAVDAVKAAKAGAGTETPSEQFFRGLVGQSPGSIGEQLRPSRLIRRLGAGMDALLHSDHPLVAIGRGAIRMLPFGGVLAGAADIGDVTRTLSHPDAPLSRKILAGVKAGAGLATIGAMGLLGVTGAAAFLPYGLAAGAVALGADVALSRLRTGHW